ncbi:XdhC family protein [Roseomonas sp. GCM10028921]
MHLVYGARGAPSGWPRLILASGGRHVWSTRLAGPHAPTEGAGETYTLATVVETYGSTSAKPGAKALLASDGAMLVRWVGVCAEAAVQRAGLECLWDGTLKVIQVDLDDEVLGTGIPCGGGMRVYVGPHAAPSTLLLLKHGALVECVCCSGSALGFRVVVDDPSETDPTKNPDAAEIITDDYGYERLAPSAGEFVIIATQDEGDHLSAVIALRSPVRYIAVIANCGLARLMWGFLLEQGFSEDELTSLYAPAGSDLGARTPDEIAFSVLGEIMILRRGASGRPMRQGASEKDWLRTERGRCTQGATHGGGVM